MRSLKLGKILHNPSGHQQLRKGSMARQLEDPSANLTFAYKPSILCNRRLQSTNCDTNEERNHGNKESRNQNGRHRASYERKKEKYFSENNQNESKLDQVDGNLNHYQRLNLDQGASVETIKSAYYSLSKLYHPDTADQSSLSAAENFRLITESYDILSDPQKRASYDESISIVEEYKPDFTSFGKPPENPKEFRRFYPEKDVDWVFRMKQEAAWEREKIQNPKKFRAGSFKGSDGMDMRKESRRETTDRLEKFALNIRQSSNSNSSDMYRRYLESSILQRLDYLRTRSHATPENDDISVITSVAGLTVFLASIVISLILFVDFKFPDRMDEKLEHFRKKISPPKVD